jgi:hypothetical protein
MPPASKKQKRAEPPPPGSAAGAAAGGRQEPGMAPPPQSAARGLQTGVVKEFLQSIQRRDRLGPDFFNDAEKQQWDEWLESVPADAAHSTDAQKLLPVQMANVTNNPPIHSPSCKLRIEGIYKRLRRERMVLCERESNSDLVKCRSCMINSVAPTANYS